eukprot:CAMPEP_0196767710 /NCGR_PEP_ID=MMETSP1095-20130614/41878_1 /TAXON_ID=96789 ORGANISM="Chromulina nebulosa, Strain UTEXLB2642" /NCGR_SAMPLE_ID=MMETSP1095 /ASSEMBLY_ACC=CAM_ASM_000446 /LENGTH=330 /DNA_ID=CAMNT_0042136279 /DNA_START=1033 /DNA_END=2025 /DNA_ORIENTATION=+
MKTSELLRLYDDNDLKLNLEGYIGANAFNYDPLDKFKVDFANPNDNSKSSEVLFDAAINKYRKVLLHEVSAVSSSAVQVGLFRIPILHKILFDNGVGVFNFWSPADANPGLKNYVKLAGKKSLPFADGGSYDNLAITSLLRRQVTDIISFNANDQNIYQPGITDDELTAAFYDISALFNSTKIGGDFCNGQSLADYNRQRQVFEQNEWELLVADLKEKSKNGEPTVYSKPLKVLRNLYAGVGGGYTVNVTFVFNSRTNGYWETVDEKIKKNLKPRSKLPAFLYTAKIDEEFPYVNTFSLKLEPELVTNLIGVAKYTFNSVINEVKSFHGL